MHTIELEKGLKVGDTTHKTATLREPSAGDLINAMAESERVVIVPNAAGGEPQLLLSNTALSINTLRRQIVSLGDIKGPLEHEQLNLLSATDLQLLQNAADTLDNAAAKAMDARGRSDATSTDTE